MNALLDEVESLRADKRALESKINSLVTLVNEEKKKRKESDTQAYSARTQQGQMAAERSQMLTQLQAMKKDLDAQAQGRQLAEQRLRYQEASVSQLKPL